MGQNTLTTPKTGQPTFVRRVWITAGITSLFIAVLYLFQALFSLLLLVLAGVLVSIYFYGVANIFRKQLHFSPRLSIIVSVCLNVILAVGFFWFIGARMQNEIAQLTDELPKTYEHAKAYLNQSPLGHKILEHYNSSGSFKKATTVVQWFFSSGFGILSDLYIVLLLAIFFTADPDLYKRGIILLLPPAAKDKGRKLLNKLNTLLKKWLIGQIFSIVFIGVLTGIGLLIMGMPMVLALAVIAGFLNAIPNFGPLIALIPAVLIALLQGPSTVLVIICMYTFIQIIQSAVEQPVVQKKMVDVPPSLVIIGQVAMGALSGFWGVLLATPVIVILMTLVNDLYVNKQTAEGSGQNERR